MTPFTTRRAAPAMAFAAALTFPLSAAAQDETAAYPAISGGLAIEIENDWTPSADDSDAELNDLYTTTELGLSVALSHALSINGLFVLEPVEDPMDDRVFEDHGAYVDELYLRYDFGPAAVYGGKIHPTFGIAWDAAPGIYGVDFAEDYELAEMIGGGVEVPFAAGGTDHVFTASVFFADTTFLSESAFTNRGRLRESDGGAANTDSAESVSLTLDGTIPNTELGYHLGARFLSGGEGDPENDTGMVAALTRTWELGNDQAVEAIGEVAYLVNQNGQDGDGVYGTLGATYFIGPWHAAASYSVREVEDSASTDHLAQAGVGYTYDLGEHGALGAEVGYRFGREGGDKSHTLGALLSYNLPF